MSVVLIARRTKNTRRLRITFRSSIHLPLSLQLAIAYLGFSTLYRKICRLENDGVQRERRVLVQGRNETRRREKEWQ